MEDQFLPHAATTHDVVEMGMGMEQILGFQTQFGEATDDVIHITARIDNKCFARLRTSDDRAVTAQRTDRKAFLNQTHSNISLTELSS